MENVYVVLPSPLKWAKYVRKALLGTNTLAYWAQFKLQKNSVVKTVPGVNVIHFIFFVTDSDAR
jgi:hypothetical protein